MEGFMRWASGLLQETRNVSKLYAWQVVSLMNLLLKLDPLSTRIRNELIAQVKELETSAKLTVFVLNISSPLLKRRSVRGKCFCFSYFAVFRAAQHITRAFQRKRPSWNLGFVFFFVFFFVQPQFAIKSLIRMRDDLTLMCAWHGVMADEERFMRWKISTNTVKNTLKTDTKYSHSVRGRPTLKVEERCRNGLVRKPYERSLWTNIFDWTSRRETCYINWAI